jgi:hypothetical protein
MTQQEIEKYIWGAAKVLQGPDHPNLSPTTPKDSPSNPIPHPHSPSSFATTSPALEAQ